MNQSGWVINCNFSFCLLSVFHKHNRQAHTEMWAKYNSSVEGTHSILPSFLLSKNQGGEGLVGTLSQVCTIKPLKKIQGNYSHYHVSVPLGKTSPVQWADQTLCLILCIEAVNCLSIKSDWWLLKRWCLVATIFIETKACYFVFLCQDWGFCSIKTYRILISLPEFTELSFYWCLKRARGNREVQEMPNEENINLEDARKKQKKHWNTLQINLRISVTNYLNWSHFKVQLTCTPWFERQCQRPGLQLH